MGNDIPRIIEVLYPYFVTGPDPSFWPDYLKDDPMKGHGLWAFYQGLQLGVQLMDACLDKE